MPGLLGDRRGILIGLPLLLCWSFFFVSSSCPVLRHCTRYFNPDPWEKIHDLLSWTEKEREIKMEGYRDLEGSTECNGETESYLEREEGETEGDMGKDKMERG